MLLAGCTLAIAPRTRARTACLRSGWGRYLVPSYSYTHTHETAKPRDGRVGAYAPGSLKLVKPEAQIAHAREPIMLNLTSCVLGRDVKLKELRGVATCTLDTSDPRPGHSTLTS